ncbi:MAG: cytochrome b [Alphaproteobacteria bacterium]
MAVVGVMAEILLRKRYHAAAILLHWLMAIAFLGMLASGLVMTEDFLDKSQKFQLYQWHKSLGVLLLSLFFVRLMVRFVARKPALSIRMKPLEKKAANLVHGLLYAIMLLLPLSGWVMVSSSPYGLPTIVFGVFEWPHIPKIAANLAIEHRAKEAHEILANFFMVLIALHIGAVLKHWLVDKENLLPRMGIGKQQEEKKA